MRYFTPHIKSVRVGYECQLLNIDWLDSVLETKHFPFVYDQLSREQVRTPYLTRKDFIKEGWVLVDAAQGYRKYSSFPFSIDHFKDEDLISIYIDVPGYEPDYIVKLIKAKCINELRNVLRGLSLIMDKEKSKFV